MAERAPSSEFRPNPKRAIYLRGTINQDLLDKLTPEILRLRSESSEAITVYIDSNGGNTQISDRIYSLLSTADFDGYSPQIITVATATAASAAADFLSSGKYAIIYPHSLLLFHGTRRQLDSPITTEAALNEANELKRANERYALKLARRSIQRFVFRYLLLAPTVAEAKKANPELENESLFAHALSDRLSGWLKNIPREAIAKQSRIRKLYFHVEKSVPRNENEQGENDSSERLAVRQASILKAIIDFELMEHPDPIWQLRSNIGALEEDFALLDELFSPEHMDELIRLADIYGAQALTEEDRAIIDNLPEQERPGTERTKILNRMHALWFLFVSICRALQSGDNFLLPHDAYWFGLVDEVLGSGFPNLRELVESQTSESSEENATAT